MMPLDSIRKRNAVKFVVDGSEYSASPYMVRSQDDPHAYNPVCLCDGVDTANVIASLLTDYAARCAARNVPLWDNALTKRAAISSRMEKEAEVTLGGILDDIKAAAKDDPKVFRRRWPIDKGYEAWRASKKEKNYE